MRAIVLAIASIGFAGLVASGSLSACSSDLSTDLSGKACDADGRCLDGYACDPVAHVCVRPSGSSTTNVTASSTSEGATSSSASGGGASSSMQASSGATSTTSSGIGGAAASSSGAGGASSSSVASSSSSGAGGGCVGKPDVCSGVCTSLATDPDNCGMCGKSCDGPVSGPSTGAPSCAADACGVTCDPATPSTCHPAKGGLACVDSMHDPQACGASCTPCGPGETCSSGACAPACPPGQASCNGACVTLASDPDNCNACGKQCAAAVGNNKCQSGACASSCQGGFTPCGVDLGTRVACVDTNKDAANCGGCGKACKQSEVCAGGTCIAFVRASACWECGDGNAFPTCCKDLGETICVAGGVCP